MGAELRVYRRRIRSVQSTKKITRAMELIAASRIVKAQQRVAAAQPYARTITRALSALASQGASLDHPLLTERPDPTRAAVLVITSDRGLAGGYNANVLRAAEELMSLLRQEGKTPVVYAVGRKAVNYYRFRGRDVQEAFTGFSEQPGYDDARAVTDTLIEAFETDTDEGGVDEIHLVYTAFVSALTQRPQVTRVLPLVVVDEEVDNHRGQATPTSGGEAEPWETARDDRVDQQAAARRGEDPLPLYEFEPSPEAVLDALLPRYVVSRVYAALLESAASESASRRRAMKSATDNAEELIKGLTRAANAARQAEITQEIAEIVGGADALAATGSD